MTEEERLERALKKERGTMARQALLMQLWKLRQRHEDKQEDVVTSSTGCRVSEVRSGSSCSEASAR